MRLRWSRRALLDLDRLYRFVSEKSKVAAADVYLALWQSPERLLQTPRIGQQIMTLKPHEVRRLIVGNYELRYEVRAEEIRVLRIWSGRENR